MSALGPPLRPMADGSKLPPLLSAPTSSPGYTVSTSTTSIVPPQPSRRVSQSPKQDCQPRKSPTDLSSPRRHSSDPGLHFYGSSRAIAGASSPTAVAMERSASPTDMQIKYTKTGRVSKARKGLKVHQCRACGKSYTRAEHLRRHQQNHNESTLQCNWPGCDRTFHRNDLLDRHRERHLNPSQRGDDETRSVTSYISATSGGIGTANPRASRPAARAEPAATAPATSGYSQSHFAPDAMQSGEVFNAPEMEQFSNLALYTGYTTGVEDLMHTGSLFDATCTPEYAMPGSGHALPENLDPYPAECDYPPHPYPMHRLRAYSESPWVAAPLLAPPSPTSPDFPQYLHLLDAGQQHVPIPAPTTINSCDTSDTSSYNWVAEQQMYSTCYPVDAVASLRSFDNLDSEEHRLLFPPHLPGILSIDRQQMTEHLGKYWQALHPHFPIKHHPTFDPDTESPLCLAAMIALGAQYSSIVGARAESRALHERCLIALAKRERAGLSTDRRLCDMQATFLVELFSQFRAKRAPRRLSAIFQAMHRCLSYQWGACTDASEQVRLLTACNILEAQANTLLARQDADPAMPLTTGNHLSADPAPGLADASSPDEFQAAQAIWTHGIHCDIISGDVDSGHTRSWPTCLAIRGSRLASSTPIRALLAVAGEAWIFSEKIASDEHAAAKRTVRQWLYATNAANGQQSARTALPEALAALALTANASVVDAASVLLPGTELVLFHAALVLWAVVAAASSGPPGPTPHPTISHQHRDAHDCLRAASAFLATKTARSADAVDTSWRKGTDDVLCWICKVLGGSEPPGELVGACVRVIEGLRSKAWTRGWF